MPRQAADARFSVAVSPALHGKLARLGLHSDTDLLFHLPLRWLDETRITPIADLIGSQHAVIDATVLDCEVRYAPRRVLIARLSDGSGTLTVRLMNFYPSQIQQLQAGNALRLSGEVRSGFLGLEMIHPRISRVTDTPPPASLTPLYPTTAGLAQSALRKLIQQTLAHADLGETLPAEVYAPHTLPDFRSALTSLHQPPPQTDLAALEAHHHPAYLRLVYDEWLAQQCSLRRARAARQARSAISLPHRGPLIQRMLDTLPFTLTDGQNRAWTDIRTDLAGQQPMRRLLQGDVGSGKTVVAALACLQAIENTAQAAFMAPTEILAEQHFLKFSEWFTPLGIQCVWLSGAMPARQKKTALAALASGEAQLAIGTHALFQEGVEFFRLGLAIIDEQHRFGVAQRLALIEKGREPHVLMMSATPIPRSLAMSYFADLDVSSIRELPPGRSPVRTRLLSETRRHEILERVRHLCAEGGQAYWVCPLIEESEKRQLQTAQDTWETLSHELPGLRIGLVHGRMKSAEKQQTMAAFKAGEIALLVATTVIEVGVDVPNASLMVIENAERMGLSQLHQLRGRVGRGSRESVCLLLYPAKLSDEARLRLKIIYESADGFEIARQDLQLRGPGELLGARQSGVPLLRFADPEHHADWLKHASNQVEALLARHPDAVDAHLARWFGARQALAAS
jgi:ATP-dependent DNA helicase RecG